MERESDFKSKKKHLQTLKDVVAVNLLPDQRFLEKKLYKVLPTLYSKSLKGQLRKNQLKFIL